MPLENQNLVPQTSLTQLQQQLGQQALPQPLQPQGYRNAAANAQLGLLEELQPGGQQFDKYQANELNRFQNQTIPQLSAQMRGKGLGAFQQATAGSLQELMERLGGQRLGFDQQRQGLLGQLLNQGQQAGQRQQEIGLQGLQGVGNLQQRQVEGPMNIQLQALQALLGAGGKQAALGLGQGGDTAIEGGAIQPMLQALVSALAAYKGGRV